MEEVGELLFLAFSRKNIVFSACLSLFHISYTLLFVLPFSSYHGKVKMTGDENASLIDKERGGTPRKALLVIVVSTTGNGEPPDNADRFWRFLKKRKHPNTLLKGLKFCVLGLGDTNYDKFCYMGKALDKRLPELGAERIYPLGCADDGTGLEQVVEPWLEGLSTALSIAAGIGKNLSPTVSTTPTKSPVSKVSPQIKTENNTNNEEGKVRTSEEDLQNSIEDLALPKQDATNSDSCFIALHPALRTFKDVLKMNSRTASTEQTLRERVKIAKANKEIPRFRQCPIVVSLARHSGNDYFFSLFSLCLFIDLCWHLLYIQVSLHRKGPLHMNQRIVILPKML